MNELAITENRPLTKQDVVAQKRLIQEVMVAVMKDGTHFGTIPGCKQPSLYKAGSEAILSTFRIAVEPTVVHTVLSGISKNAPHPNAAKLFQDFLLSEEGQRIILSFDKNPTRKGLYVPWYPKGIKEFVSDPRQMDREEFDRYQNMFREIFGK